MTELHRLTWNCFAVSIEQYSAAISALRDCQEEIARVRARLRLMQSLLELDEVIVELPEGVQPLSRP